MFWLKFIFKISLNLNLSLSSKIYFKDSKLTLANEKGLLICRKINKMKDVQEEE